MAIEVGSTAIFAGYSALEEGQTPILTAKEQVVVISHDATDDSFNVRAANDETRIDNVFPEELEEIVTQAVAPAKSSRRRAANAPAEAAPVAEAIVPAAAPVKAATAGKGRGKATAAPAAAAVSAPVETKAPASKPKAVAEAKPLVIIETIADMVGSRQSALDNTLALAKQLGSIREQEEQTVFSLGGLLCYVRDEEAYKDAGYADMAAYVAGALGLKERAGQYYMSLYQELTDAGVTVKQIEGIGWTKLRALIGTINKDNKKELLAQAKKMTRDQLVDHMKEVKAKIGKTSPTDPNKTTFVKFGGFKLFDDQANVLTRAVDSAKTTYEVDNMGEALHYMAVDWLQTRNEDVPLHMALAALNARYNTSYGENDEEQGEDQAAEA